MGRIARAIPTYILPYKAIVVWFVLLTAILAVQYGFNWLIEDNTPVWEGTCSKKEWYVGDSVGMVVSCGARGEDILTGRDFLYSYLNNPGPLTCRQYETGSIGCDERPALEVAE